MGKQMEDLRNKLQIVAPRCKGAYLEEAPKEIWEGGWGLEPKEDGNRVTLEIGKTCSIIIGRNRQDFMKGVEKAGAFRCLNYLNPKLAKLKNSLVAPSLLDGELTECFTQDGSLDEDTEVRKQQGLFTGFTTWTCLVYKGKDIRGESDELRRIMTREIVRNLSHPKVRLIERLSATLKNLKILFDRGLEGAIAKKLEAPIPINQRTNPYWWKIKGDDRRTVDAVVIGVTGAKSGGSGLRGIKPKLNGEAASFTVGMLRDGKIIEVGKMINLPGDAKLYGLNRFYLFEGRVVEMKVSGWSGKRFRWPRFVKWRPDKTVNDCQFSEQVGE